MVPVATVFVIGHHHQHVFPLRAGTQFVQHVGNVGVATHDVGVRRVLVVAPGRFVERHGRQLARTNVCHEVFAVLDESGTVCRPRRKARVVVERLVMRLKIR